MATQKSDQTVACLPRTRGKYIKTPARGRWDLDVDLPAKLADDIDISGQVGADALSSIPTVWARPRLFAQALFGPPVRGDPNRPGHPLHQHARDQWRGVLGIFCFGEHYGFTLKHRRIVVGKSGVDEVDTAFQASPESVLWPGMDLIYLGEKLLCGSSPLTLWFTPPDPIYVDEVPWTTVDGILYDPLRYFKETSPTAWQDEIGILAGWLRALEDQLRNAPGLRPAHANQILEHIRLWREEAGPMGTEIPITLGPPLFDGGYHAIATSPALLVDHSIGRSDFMLADHRKLADTGLRPVILIGDPTIEGDRLALSPFRLAEIVRPDGVAGDHLVAKTGRPIQHAWLRPDLLFTKKIVNLAANKNEILGASSAEFVPPLDKTILDYFGPSDLDGIISWRSISDGVEVTLKLPVNDHTGKRWHYEVRKEYRESRDEIVRTIRAPFVLLWPDFVADDMALYLCAVEKIGHAAIGNTQNIPLVITPIGGDHVHDRPGPEPVVKSVVWSLDNFPEALHIHVAALPAGLILLKPRPRVKSGSEKWSLALDFGTTNTTIMWQSGNDAPQRLHYANRVVRISPSEEVGDLVFDSFTEFLPTGDSSRYSIAGMYPSNIRLLDSSRAILEPILDSIILFDEPARWTDAWQLKGVEENLKWEPIQQQRQNAAAFLAQSMIMAAVEARAKGVREADLHWSYPTAFSRALRNQLDIAIQQLTAYARRLGVTVTPHPPETESVAVCSYMRRHKGAETEATEWPQVMLDIGGGTTDLAIWLNGGMIAQTSLRIAGGVLGNLVKERRKLRERLAQLAEELGKWKDVEKLLSEKWMTGLNVMMKYLGDKMIAKVMSTGLAYDKGEMQRARTVLFFAFAAVFFYAGTMLRGVAGQRTAFSGCSFHLAGNGARLFPLVAGRFALEQALTQVVRAGAEGVKLGDVEFSDSDNPKEEVARGLLYREVSAALPNYIDHPVGEDGYELGGTRLTRTDMLSIKAETFRAKDLKVPAAFPVLAKYCNVYNNLSGDLTLDRVDTTLEGRIQARMQQRIRELEDQLRMDNAVIQPMFIEEVRAIVDLMIRPGMANGA